jgi:hypothetical protein
MNIENSIKYIITQVKTQYHVAWMRWILSLSGKDTFRVSYFVVSNVAEEVPKEQQ